MLYFLQQFAQGFVFGAPELCFAGRAKNLRDGAPLPDGLAARDLPEGLRPLAGPGPEGSTVLHSESPLVHLQMLGNWALGRGFDLPDLDVHRPTLEEVYLSLTSSTSTKDYR